MGVDRTRPQFSHLQNGAWACMDSQGPSSSTGWAGLKLGQGAWETAHGRPRWESNRGRVESRCPSTQSSPLPVPPPPPRTGAEKGRRPGNQGQGWGLGAGSAREVTSSPSPFTANQSQALTPWQPLHGILSLSPSAAPCPHLLSLHLLGWT